MIQIPNPARFHLYSVLQLNTAPIIASTDPMFSINLSAPRVSGYTIPHDPSSNTFLHTLRTWAGTGCLRYNMDIASSATPPQYITAIINTPDNFFCVHLCIGLAEKFIVSKYPIFFFTHSSILPKYFPFWISNYQFSGCDHFPASLARWKVGTNFAAFRISSLLCFPPAQKVRILPSPMNTPHPFCTNS